MNPIDDLDPAELLGVPPDASTEEVRRAYERLAAALAPGSLALYSLATPEEQSHLAERLHEAYLALSGGGSGPTPPPAHPTGAPASVVEPRPARPHTGATLRDNRIARDLSLDEVAKHTRVRPQQLAWIEEEAFDRLPARVYTRGFVMAYARALNLDPDEVWADLASRWDARSDHNPEEHPR